MADRGDRVRLERHGDVAAIVLDDPPLNLFGEELTRDLLAALDEVERELPRALMVRAEGDVFTAGADVHVFDDKTPDEAAAFFSELVRTVHRIEDLPIPTFASVHGLCLTAGFELSLAFRPLPFFASTSGLAVRRSTFGARPNSVAHTTSVLSSRPRCLRSISRAAIGWSTALAWSPCLARFECWSQLGLAELSQ